MGAVFEMKNRLIGLRKEKKMTQREVADKLGIARTTYSGYENGSREPDNDTLQKLADFFGCTLDYLLGRSEIKYNENKLDEKDRRAIDAYMNLPEEIKNNIRGIIHQFNK